jgi:hypothetical protein
MFGDRAFRALAGGNLLPQAAPRALGGGRLRDELGRQFVVEIGNGEGLGHADIGMSEARLAGLG